MKILLLAGQSIKNKEWIYNIASYIKNDFDDVKVMDYDHWENGDDDCNIELEISKVNEVTKEWGEYIVFAKSIGSVISILGYGGNKIGNKPKRIVIVGFPFIFAKEKGVDMTETMKSFTIDTNIYQKENDPFGGYFALSEIIKEIGNPIIGINKYECNDESSDDHHYANLETIKTYLLK